MSEAGQAARRDDDGEPDPGLKRWPLSYAQELLWFLGKKWPSSDLPTRFTVATTETFAEPLDLQRLRRALATIVRRHEVLRAAVVEEQRQTHVVVVVENPPLPFTYHDLRALGAGREERATELLIELGREPISVYEAPAARFHLVSVEADLHYLLVTVHHLFFDYWSAQMLKTELLELYRSGHEPPADEIQYVDYATWEREVLRGEHSRSGLDHWLAQLSDLPALELPTDRRRPWIATGAARRATTLVEAPVVARLRALGTEAGASLFMVMNGIFLCLLAHTAKQRDVAIPTIFSGRIHPATWGMLGYFDNLLFLRYRYDERRTVREVLADIREVGVSAYEHHDVPLLRIVEEEPRLLLLLGNAVNVWVLFHLEVDPESLHAGPRDASPAPAGPAGPAGGDDGAQLERADDPDDPDDPDDEVYSFGADLDVTLRETQSGLYVRALFNVDLFDRPRIDALLECYRSALLRALDAPDRPVGELFA